MRHWLLTLAATIAGCSGATQRAIPPEVATAAWQVRASGGMQSIALGTTGPIPSVRGVRSISGALALTDAKQCQACHREIFDEWASSRHALAWTNSIFATEYRSAPKPWCVNCHAPTDAQQAGLARQDSTLANNGVDCASCHVRNGTLVNRVRAVHSPHQTVVDATFGSPAFCADCHNFTFPVLSPAGIATAMTPHPMQSTVDEFRRGKYGKEPDGCMTCHGSKSNHGWRGGHDEGMLNAAVTVAVCATKNIASAAAELRVVVANAAAGHNIPTGDLHRHFNLRVWRSSAPENLFEGFIGRRYTPAPGGGKTITFDSTLAPGRDIRYQMTEKSLGGELDEDINVQLDYVFIGNEFIAARQRPNEAIVVSPFSLRTKLADIERCK
jgi:hypothetical protein